MRRHSMKYAPGDGRVRAGSIAVSLLLPSLASCGDTGLVPPPLERVAAETEAVVSAPPIEPPGVVRPERRGPFQVEEATIGEIQRAILQRRLTTTELVTTYLRRIQAY